KQIRELLSGINRSSGSSGWLKDLFLQGQPAGSNQGAGGAQSNTQTAQSPASYDAMVNYESTLIETNQELLRRGLEPLYIIYPTDGLVIADSQLGYVDHGDKAKEQFFRKLQDYLLSDKIQTRFLQLGRRTGFAGELTNAPADVFRADW